MDRQIIFTETGDPRLVTVRRGGTLQDADHCLLAVWATSTGVVVASNERESARR